MENLARLQVYPPKLRPPLWKEQIRFWWLLGSATVDRQARRKLRSAVLLSSPSFVRRLVWRRFVAPLPDHAAIPMSTQAAGYLERLRRDGIVALDRDFGALADYVRERYFSREHELPGDSPLRANGLVVRQSLSFSDRRLHEVLFDPDICAMICNYYGRQAYYRDNPTVHKEFAAPDSRPLVSGVFHSDAYRQISFMLLLADLSERDTHMEFAKGSHLRQQPSYDRRQIDQDAVPRLFEMAHVAGKKGTLFVFDTEGLHRGAYHQNTGRQILHANVTTGTWPFTDTKYRSLDTIFDDVRSVPAYVREFVSGAIG
jgi:hypothetical protein